MYKIYFTEPDGSVHAAEAPEGGSVMQAAKGAGEGGVVAVCGGSMMCGTCHVYVDSAWTARVGPPSEDEEAVLEILAPKILVDASSRLSCQIKMNAALDGLQLRLPASQPGI